MHQVQVDEGTVIIRNDDRKLWVECMVHLADGSFITPEGIVVLAVLSIRVADCGEHLVPRSGIGVCLWHAVWWLHCDWEDIAGRRDGHASAEHHLLAVAVQYTVV